MMLSIAPASRSSRKSLCFLNVGLSLYLVLGWVIRLGAEENAQALAANRVIDQFQITEIAVWPEKLELTHHRDVRRVVALGRTPEGLHVDLTRKAEYRLASEQIARFDADGFVAPIKNGQTQLHVSVGGHQLDIPVIVQGLDEPNPISFVREVMPIISKVGCNAGTCHGADKGKNGFRLSLRGYDTEFDYESLVEDLSGRRFNRTDPAKSLMLLKPTQTVPHGGGLRVEVGSPFYNVLRQWITEGVNYDGEIGRVQRLEVIPQLLEIPLPDMQQQVVVVAHYPDGKTADVTRMGHYTSTSTEVAEVDERGLVTAIRRGESALVVSYEGVFATVPIYVLGERPGYQWQPVPEYHFIDTLVYQKLRQVKILPSEVCKDAEFLRRVQLDLTGIPPTPEEVRAFLADPTDPRTKRQRLVERLLASPEYVDHWTHKWCDLLQVNRKYLGEKGIWVFRRWVRQSVATNKPYDQLVRELLTSTGSSSESPPANYFRINDQPDMAVENISQLFLGTRFMCAKCHDHPFERWTQNNYYELAAFFARVSVKPGDSKGEEIVFEGRGTNEVTHPKTGEVVQPDFPFEFASESNKVTPEWMAAENSTRRERLAQWLTSPENPLFARSAVNRVWSYFLGRGIVEPVDDLRDSNPPSNPELLDALAEDFINHGFDMKHLMRTIVNSRVYQHSVKTNPFNEDDAINFSHAIPRRLMAEQLLDAITLATGVPQKFSGLPMGFRANQLPDPDVSAGGFLELFGRPPRESPCECERTSEVSLAHALNLINGSTIATSLSDPNSRVAKLVAQDLPPEQIVEEIYMAALCRPPTGEEVAAALEYFATAHSNAEAAEDILWALLNSPAFLFNR